MKIALIDYGAGNLHSAGKALLRALDEAGISGNIVLGSSPENIMQADRIVLPGDGAFKDCIDNLSSIDGLIEVLREQIIVKGRPFLGICVGMQLLADIGEEREITNGLGWIKGRVVAISPQDKTLKVPHMGWNNLKKKRNHPIIEGVDLGEDGLHAYFLHSYHLIPKNEDDLVACAQYGGNISAIVARDNIVGTQFHPEKSQRLGAKLLTNFVKWKP